MNKTNGFLISFLLGGAIGSTVALLYAPKSGRNLRNDIGRKTGELIEEGKKLANDSRNAAKDLAESTFNNANDFLNTGVSKIVNKAEKVRDAVQSGFNAYNDERRYGNDQNSTSKEDVENTHSHMT